MPTVSIKIIPIGVGTGLSRYIARAVVLLEEEGYKPIVTPDNTIIQVRDLSEIGAIIRKIHDELYSMGIVRIVTIVTIDDRRDREELPQEKVSKVLSRLEEERRNIKNVHGVI